MRKILIGLGFASALSLVAPALAEAAGSRGSDTGMRTTRHRTATAPRYRSAMAPREVRQVQRATPRERLGVMILPGAAASADDFAAETAGSEFIARRPYPYETPEVLNARTRNAP